MVRKGFTLIEALTLLFIFSVVTITFYSVFASGSRQILEVKNRLGAVAVANEKMEIARNLDYAALGTKKLEANGSYSYGIPAGEILEDETIAVNTKSYAVHTFVQYVDDAFDGKVSGTAPADAIPNDYKRVKITVSWGSGDASQSVDLVSTFVPKGMEVASGGGTLSINVIDSAGTGVSQATVHITNTSVNPHVDTTTSTDSTGNLVLVGAAASSQSYQLQVSKSGYYEATTHAPYPTTTYNPIDIHASVVAAAFNQKTITLDKASDIPVTSEDPFGASLPDIAFHLIGGRKLGDTIASGSTASKPVYSLDQDFTSGSDGKKSMPAQSAGAYVFSLTGTSDSKYRLLRLSSDESVQNAFSATDGAAADIHAILIDQDVSAALVTVDDASSGTAVPMQGASVHLSNASLAYDATVTTDRYGQAYFPTALPALAAGTYDYTVTMTGYGDKTGTIVVGSGLKTEAVSLIPS